MSNVTAPEGNEAAPNVQALQNRNMRFSELEDLLRYTFRAPSAYGSHREKLVGRRGGLLCHKERIYPIAYRRSQMRFVFGSGFFWSGSNVPFVWMADDGALVIRHFGYYEIISCGNLAMYLTDRDYGLLLLWLSNDSTGALNLIN